MIRLPAPLTLCALLLSTAGCDRVERDAPAAARVDSNEITAGEPVAEPQGAVVIVSVTGVEPGGESVEAALQTEAQWGEEATTYRARVPADADAVALRFEGVAPGRYGVIAVQPVLPAVTPRSPAAAAGDEEPTTPTGAKATTSLGTRAPASLAVRTAGGWAATGATGRKLPGWHEAARAIGSDGDTVPLTLTRR